VERLIGMRVEQAIGFSGIRKHERWVIDISTVFDLPR
jgi:hypothetical protein